MVARSKAAEGKAPIQSELDRMVAGRPVPRDVKLAVELMRTAIRRPISMADLVQHCGVAERTLNEHFRAFFEMSPMRFLRQLRLAAARESLLAGEPGTSVTQIAKRYGFNHFGRFAGQYRDSFGEAPSATLRRGRIAANSQSGRRGEAEPTSPEGASQEPAPRLCSREPPSLAILPCRTSAKEPSLHWLSESLAEATAAALGSSRSLAVMTPRSLQPSQRDPQGLARELNARYFLTGRIMCAESRLRIILRVVDSATGRHVWGESFDGSRDRPLELQDLIIADFVRAILPRIRGAEIDRARRARPDNLDAYGLAMRALPFVFASRPASACRALELLDRAIEIDPDYALAAALAAWCHGQLVMYNGTLAPAEERRRALQLIHRAAILDDDDSLALVARCAVHIMAGEFDVAESLVTRVLAADPFFGWAWGRSAWLHSYKGDSETAIRQFGRALALDPNRACRANYFAGIGSAHFNAGRYGAAASCLQRALTEDPGMWWANRSLSVSYARLGHRLKALDSLDRLRRASPDLTVGRVVSAVPFRQDFLDRLGDGLSELGLPP